jgi:diaminopimelate epimerase
MKFYKYHGAGNDFIIIDDRKNIFDAQDTEKIKLLCHRRFGIGADGILVLRGHPEYDFEMLYMNSDGSIGAMCGNGGRCIVHFAHFVLKIIKNPKNIKFLAADGEHKAQVLSSRQGLDECIKLKMQDVNAIGTRNDLPFVCQGTTPHNIYYVEDLKNFPVVETGRKIRYADPNGVNVNFVEIIDGIFNVRTYERGVEDETLACGTGATSVAITSHHLGKLSGNICHIKYPGGDLKVEFEKESEGKYKNIYLTGPAVCVFKGETSF